MKLTGVLFLVFLSLSGFAQPLVQLAGAEVFIGENAQVLVDGSLAVSDQSELDVNGELFINNDFETSGIFSLSGSLYVAEDLFFNAITNQFSANSKVFLSGLNQTLNSIATLSVGELFCFGTQEKTLESSIEVQRLFLDSAIILTQGYELVVLNSNEQAISYSEGWLRSDSAGGLYRNMLSGNTYDFPVGNTEAQLLIRVSPLADGISGLRYAEADASDEGLFRSQVDPSLCSLNSEAYIRFYNTVALQNQLEIRFPVAMADNFSVLCEREASEFQSWQELSQVSPTILGDVAVYQITPTVNEVALILGRLRPNSPLIVGPEEACQGESGQEFQALQSNGNTLLWTIGGGLISSQQDSTVEVHWKMFNSGLVSVVVSDAFGCSSIPSQLSIELFPLPEALINVTEPPLPFELEVFTLESQSTGSSSIDWDISTGEEYNYSPLSLRFETPGIYSVLLTAISDEGCIDTASVALEVIEGFIFSNVFSPNGDGINDELKLPNSGLLEFSLKVFSRWGNEVYNSQFSKLSWDGRDSSGNLVPAGTYFYLLEAKSSSNDYSKRGSLQVMY
ncbi:MAG: gliding motility-associated C-terminal domain-containing protein [Bacteroidia bacterium]